MMDEPFLFNCFWAEGLLHSQSGRKSVPRPAFQLLGSFRGALCFNGKRMNALLEIIGQSIINQPMTANPVQRNETGADDAYSEVAPFTGTRVSGMKVAVVLNVHFRIREGFFQCNMNVLGCGGHDVSVASDPVSKLSGGRLGKCWG
jgi:hypothetical protein